MSDRERRKAFRDLTRFMIGLLVGAVVLLMMVAYSAQLKNDKSSVALQRALRHPDPAIRERALRIIARDSLMQRVNCATLVSPILDPIDRVRSAAMPVVTESLTGDRCDRQIFAALDTSPSTASRMLLLQAIAASGRSLGNIGHTALLRALENDSATRGFAAMALASTSDSSPTTLRALRRAFRSNTGSARGEALLALLSLEPKCENERLLEQGFEDSDAEVRVLAMQAWRRLLNNPHTRCPNVSTALEMLLRDKQWRVRATAVGLILEHGTARQRELLRPLLTDSVAEVRQTVKLGLERLQLQ